MKHLSEVVTEFIDRNPSAGYIGAATPTLAGFWALVENVTKIGALLSVAVGLTVGIITLRVQLLHKRRLEAELIVIEAAKK